MSLGLFNCRLIQPAGDQLFFFSAVLPRRCQFGQALFSLLVTRPARPRPTGGRRMLLVFPSQKDSFLVFRGAKSRRAQKGSLPPIHPRIPPKIPQSYPQIPLQTQTLDSAQLTRSIHAGETSTFLPGHQFLVATSM